ncbi:MAG: DUF4982 domain-containing protein [Clostridia bacterium]|nr:DUF4982 domain-containing protein [Clostridia bacterium]
MRTRKLWNDGWLFHLGDYIKPTQQHEKDLYYHAKTRRYVSGPAAYITEAPKDYYCYWDINSWSQVTLPHDYVLKEEVQPTQNAMNGFHEYKNGWYRKVFPADESFRGKRTVLYFEGVAANLCEVYCNGVLLKRSVSCYTPFEVDISDVLRFGQENLISVYLKQGDPEGWWYSGGGIYRNVWLDVAEPVSVDRYGVFVCPKKVNDTTWHVPVETQVRNDGFEDAAFTVSTELLTAEGCIVASDTVPGTAEAGEKGRVTQHFTITDPVLWNLEQPTLYKVRTTLTYQDTVVDTEETRFGFRTIEFNTTEGCVLNGTPVKLAGVCCHTNNGLVGLAVPESMQRYRLRLLKEMGVNAYRCAHYPHQEATMDAMDEFGFIVMAETRWFESSDEGLAQLETLIRRDRNHPCVAMWSIGNEEMIHSEPEGARIAKTMIRTLKKLDSSRPITCAIVHDPANAPMQELMDVIGVNYDLEAMEKLHEKFPNKPIVATELCATPSTRGWYQDNDMTRGYYSAYDKTFYYPLHVSREFSWKWVNQYPWMVGAFQWSGCEYLGETAWPRLCSQSGAIDLFLQKKEAFYVNQSHWTKKPMVYVMPHWNWEGREGDLIRVCVLTNCPVLELFLNGESLGRKEIEMYGHGEWQVPYAPGSLMAKGYDSNGNEIASNSVETTGAPVSLELQLMNQADYTGEPGSVAVVNCICRDQEGRLVPDAEPVLHFSILGDAEILGTGSDVCDHVPPHVPDRKMRAGLCAAAVRLLPAKDSTMKPTRVVVTAQGLKVASLEL